jgi:hypothetical protein
MQQFTIGYLTIPGVADSTFLDQLAEIVYEIEELGDPILSLNDDGSITASFDVRAADPLEAVETAARLFVEAFREVGPSSQAQPLLSTIHAAPSKRPADAVPA